MKEKLKERMEVFSKQIDHLRYSYEILNRAHKRACRDYNKALAEYNEAVLEEMKEEREATG